MSGKEPDISELARFADDPEWWKAIPEADISRAHRAVPAPEDCSPAGTAAADALGPSGALHDLMPGYEPRPGQIDMARAVSRAFDGASHLMIEAGTGVGKSLAYLVPALRWAVLNDTPVVVSTATRNLQSQLVEHDIPLALATLPQGSNARTALLKGRANYACLRMVEEFFRDGVFAFDDSRVRAASRIASWIKSTKDGDLDNLAQFPEIDASTRAQLSCSGEECAGRGCPFQRRCFAMKARAAASRAHLVVANHSLVLAEAAGGGAGSILPAYGRIIFDEAHNLENIATEHFSFEFSIPALSKLLGRLSRMRGRGAHRREYGALASAARALARGALSGAKCAPSIEENIRGARNAINDAFLRADALCTVLSALLDVPGAASLRLIRFRTAQGSAANIGSNPRLVRRQYNINGLFADYKEFDEESLAAAAAGFEDAMARIRDCALAAARGFADCAENESQPDGRMEEIAAKLQNSAESVASFAVELKFILAASDPDYVYWAVRPSQSGPPASGRPSALPSPVRLAAAPLTVAGPLHKLFFDVKDTAILCSATLRVGSSFSYMASRLGFDRIDPSRAVTLVASSPFDYLRQSAVFNLQSAGNPAESPEYARELAKALPAIATVTQGRMLVLFTSLEMMAAAAAAAEEPLARLGIRLAVQRPGESRERLAKQLRCATGPTVLFGAQSFWEGVDVPGAALSCVVIARLPFPQSGEPIVAARCEQIEERGGSAFREYTIPEAVLRFRQGFGRLVRSQSDTGVVVVTDPRLTAKNYGKIFAKSLPVPVRAVASTEELSAQIAASGLIA